MNVEDLPIYEHKERIIETLKYHQVLVVEGPTGCGKTTQVPKYILQAGFHPIAVTQPRRIAAISVAYRVAEELQVPLGEEAVGYAIRFEVKCKKGTRLKYMTDGFLLQESTGDPTFGGYSVIILDEVHERSLQTDLLLGLVKKAMKTNRNLKVVIMSATMDAAFFSKFFDHAPKIVVPGRLYPVEIRYMNRPSANYVEDAIELVGDILNFERGTGHILIFLTGEDEIHTVVDDLKAKWMRLGVSVYPLFGNLQIEDQRRVFQDGGGRRKIIVATNIAETSITIDGIEFVIDCGFHKLKQTIRSGRVELLVPVPISKANAVQRSGRAGRTQPGICFRLYERQSYEHLLPSTPPEICRSNVSQVLLQLAKHELLPDNFDFVDMPPPHLLLSGLSELHDLQAINLRAEITGKGELMSRFPLDPILTAALINAENYDCTVQIAGIAAMLSVANPFMKCPRGLDVGQTAWRYYSHQDGDHMTLLKVFDNFLKAMFGTFNPEDTTSEAEHEKAAKAWCHERWVHYRHIRQALNIRNQLLDILKKLHIPCHEMETPPFDMPNYSNNVRRALLEGLHLHLAYSGAMHWINADDEKQFCLHPTVAIKAVHKQDWVMYQEAVVTQNKYLRCCTAVERRWLTQYPHLKPILDKWDDIKARQIQDQELNAPTSMRSKRHIVYE